MFVLFCKSFERKTGYRTVHVTQKSFPFLNCSAVDCNCVCRFTEQGVLENATTFLSVEETLILNTSHINFLFSANFHLEKLKKLERSDCTKERFIFLTVISGNFLEYIDLL